MARPYGGRTGNPSLPSTSEAPGAWVAPTEIARQKGLSAWPLVQEGVPNIEAGGYVFALTSGVADTAVDGGFLYEADGSDKNRTTDSDLFEVIGTTYGSGDGSTTFGIPDVNNDPYNFLKSTTVSGLSLAALSGVGVLPHHTHTVNGAIGVNTGDPRSQSGNPSFGGRFYSVNLNTDVGNEGASEGNVARHRQGIILIGRASSPCPIGCAFPALIPVPDSEIAEYIPNGLIIASGQDVSRSENPQLFSQVGIHFGPGDSSTTFGLPDLGGLFFKGLPVTELEPSGTLPSGYILDNFASHTHTVALVGPGGGNARDTGGDIKTGPALTAPATPNSSVVGDETRGPNVSVVWVVVGG